MNENAAGYASTRAAELVGMKWVDGELVGNPDAEWAITDTTRDAIRSAVDAAFRDGLSPDDLSTEIEGIIDDEARADMIARTELAMAQSAGTMDGWRDSGVVSGKEWILSNDHPTPDDCDDNADDGVIPLDDPFSSGDDAPPIHANCECDVLAVVDEGEEE